MWLVSVKPSLSHWFFHIAAVLNMGRKHILVALLSLLYLSSCSCLPRSSLFDGDSLNTGESLTNGAWSFVMQEDCNLVLYNNTVNEWSSNTQGKGTSCRATMQVDGNFVVYSDTTPVWDTQTEDVGPPGGYSLNLYPDGYVLLQWRGYPFYTIEPRSYAK